MAISRTPNPDTGLVSQLLKLRTTFEGVSVGCEALFEDCQRLMDSANGVNPLTHRDAAEIERRVNAGISALLTGVSRSTAEAIGQIEATFSTKIRKLRNVGAPIASSFELDAVLALSAQCRETLADVLTDARVAPSPLEIRLRSMPTLSAEFTDRLLLTALYRDLLPAAESMKPISNLTGLSNAFLGNFVSALDKEMTGLPERVKRWEEALPAFAALGWNLNGKHSKLTPVQAGLQVDLTKILALGGTSELCKFVEQRTRNHQSVKKSSERQRALEASAPTALTRLQNFFLQRALGQQERAADQEPNEFLQQKFAANREVATFSDSNGRIFTGLAAFRAAGFEFALRTLSLTVRIGSMSKSDDDTWGDALLVTSSVSDVGARQQDQEREFSEHFQRANLGRHLLLYGADLGRVAHLARNTIMVTDLISDQRSPEEFNEQCRNALSCGDRNQLALLLDQRIRQVIFQHPDLGDQLRALQKTRLQRFNETSGFKFAALNSPNAQYFLEGVSAGIQHLQDSHWPMVFNTWVGVATEVVGRRPQDIDYESLPKLTYNVRIENASFDQDPAIEEAVGKLIRAGLLPRALTTSYKLRKQPAQNLAKYTYESQIDQYVALRRESVERLAQHLEPLLQRKLKAGLPDASTPDEIQARNALQDLSGMGVEIKLALSVAGEDSR